MAATVWSLPGKQEALTYNDMIGDEVRNIQAQHILRLMNTQTSVIAKN